jgi:FkbM family methyltransferase
MLGERYRRVRLFFHLLRWEVRGSAWRLLLQKFRPVVNVTGNEKPMRVDLRDIAIGQGLYTRGYFEPHVNRLIRALPLDGKVAVDVGANIGVHTIHLSEAVGTTGRVFAFEPEPHVAELLRENCALNGSANVMVLQAAVGAASGYGWVNRNPNGNLGDNRIRLTRDNAGTRVEIVSLDDCLAEVGDGQVEFVKIDVQGYEMEVLRGMHATIERNPELILLIEMDPNLLREAGHSGPALAAELRELGFSGWEYLNGRLIPIGDEGDYDLFEAGAYTDLIVSRRPERLARVLARWYRALQNQ